MQSYSKERELWIDILRGLGILFVILGHCSPPFNKLIYGFHMPLFFLLSGYLYHGPHKIQYHLRRYIIPYFVMCGINLLIVIAITVGRHSDTSNIKKYIAGILYSRGTTEWLPNCSPLWFLTCIFLTLVIMDFIYRLKNNCLIVAVCLLCGTLSGIMSYTEMPKMPWNLDTALMAVFFMCLGLKIREGELIKKMPGWFVPIALVAGIAAIYFNPIDHVDFDGNRYGNVVLMLVGAVMISSVLFFICKQIHWHGRMASVLSWFGQHTLFIMGFDYFAGSLARSVLSKVGFQNWLSVFILKLVLLTAGCVAWNWAVWRSRKLLRIV